MVVQATWPVYIAFMEGPRGLLLVAHLFVELLWLLDVILRSRWALHIDNIAMPFAQLLSPDSEHQQNAQSPYQQNIYPPYVTRSLLFACCCLQCIHWEPTQPNTTL